MPHADTERLTIEEAATRLNTSTRYVADLIEKRTLATCTEHGAPWVLASSLEQYKQQDDACRRAAADELTSLAREMGL
ncbi:hypothetical protein [Streptomyces sp. NPDC056670]|uniref:hypothetical protein n=1 Tax=Streptomyces sp. NPDC056670 TaxID=3345904 RepID=UPI0036CE7F84